ncbi:hypothetical protein ARMSODRAFT_184939 [Armillaria solidipes]|uniref:Uncharacterized protein n=1 Tax=Armillaria solidipes TaxID=1076256 RepID=A0A2H3BG50_9AGAR|nr:hypothetical protein ARMSODRAFT_184939 [Armillaria solidipes]
MTCQASSSADPCQYSGRKFRAIPFCAGSVSTRYACQKRCHCFSITIIRTGAIVSRPISIKRTPPLGVPSREDSLFIPIKRPVRLFRRGESQGRFGSYDLSISFPNCVQHILSALIQAILPSKSITSSLPACAAIPSSNGCQPPHHTRWSFSEPMYHAMLMELGGYPATTRRGCRRTRLYRELHSATMVF